MDADYLYRDRLSMKDEVERLGRVPLGENITIKELGVSSGIIQHCYRVIKSNHFSGTLIDLLCLMSTARIQHDWLLFTELAINRRFDFIITIRSERAKLRFCLASLIEIVLQLEADGRNTIRLLVRNPNFFFSLDSWKRFTGSFQHYEEEYIESLFIETMTMIYVFQGAGYGSERIGKIFEGLNGKIKSPEILKQSRGAERESILVTPNEKRVLGLFVEYLANEGGDRIASAKNKLATFCAFRKNKLSSATIFFAIKGLEEAGLLRRVEDIERADGVRSKTHVYELVRERLENSKISVRKKGLHRSG